LSDAHLYKAVWRIWGCNMDGWARMVMEKAQEQLAPSFERRAIIKYTWSAKRARMYVNERAQLSLAYFLRNIRKDIRASYVWAVPEGVGELVGCFAALPGFGSVHTASDMFVVHSVAGPDPETGPALVADVSRDPVFTFYLRELGKESQAFVDRFGYFEHRFIAEAIEKWALPAFDHRRFRMRDFIADAKGPRWELRVASGATVKSPARRVKLETVEVKTGLVAPGKAGHLFSGRGGRVARTAPAETLEIFLEPDADTDCAVFMQEDGRLYAMSRPKGTESWVVEARPILRIGDKGKPLSPAPGGLIHNATEVW